MSSALGTAHTAPATVRLTSACFLSAAAHLLFLFLLPVNLTAGMPGITPSVIVARLAPATSDQAQDAATMVPAATAEEPAPAPASDTAPVEPVAQPPAEPERGPALADARPTTAGIELPLIRDPTYYPAKQLDAYPEPLVPIRLQYPDSALADQVDGRLLLLILIDEFGMVTEVSAVEAEPAGYFEQAADQVFRGIRFKPAMKEGRAVKCRVQVRFTYGESEGAMN